MFTIQKTPEFNEWLAGLRDRRGRAAVIARVARLENEHVADTKYVGDGVLETRIHCGPGYRVYFQKRGREIVILLCGGDKSTQDRDIAKALQLSANLGPLES